MYQAQSEDMKSDGLKEGITLQPICLSVCLCHRRINLTHLVPGPWSWWLYWHISWSASGCRCFPVGPVPIESCTERSCKTEHEQMWSRSESSHWLLQDPAHPDVSRGARYQRGTAPIPAPLPQEHSQSKKKTIGRERQSSWESFSVVSGRKWQSWMDLMTLETPLCSLDSVNILNVSNAERLLLGIQRAPPFGKIFGRGSVCLTWVRILRADWYYWQSCHFNINNIMLNRMSLK